MIAAGGPARGAAADVVHEPAQDARALAGMGDLGMELDPVEAAGLVGDSGNRSAVRRCDALEPRRQGTHAIAVAHPHVEQAVPVGIHVILDAGEQPRMTARADLRVSELAVIGGLDLASELRRHRLHAVADPEHRHPELEHRVRSAVARRLVDRFGAAGEDDALRREGAEPLRVDVERVDLGVHVRLAHPPGDELGVLRAEIEDDDPVGMDVGRGGHGRWPAPGGVPAKGTGAGGRAGVRGAAARPPEPALPRTIRTGATRSCRAPPSRAAPISPRGNSELPW